MDVEVTEPVYSISNEAFSLSMGRDLIESPATKKNIVKLDRKEAKNMLDFAKELQIPSHRFGQNVQLDQIMILNEPSSHFMLTVTNDHNELRVIEIAESPDNEGLEELKAAALNKEKLMAGDISINLLSFEDVQTALFRHDSLFYTITYNGTSQSRKAFTQTVESLSKEHPFKKYLQLDLEELEKNFAIYHTAKDPANIAINMYSENGVIQRDIEFSREDYTLTRYLPAVK